MSKMGLLSHKSLFCLFLMTSVVFILSWFLVLRSTGPHHSVDFSILPNSKLFALSYNENFDKSSVMSASKDKEEETAWNKYSKHCDPNKQVLKVFMYDLPSEFHFELLDWKAEGKSVWPDVRAKVPEYPGGLNLQHSIEYWLTLDLLNSEFAVNLSGRSAVRVRNSSEADVLFVPFFSSICYNRFSKLKPNQKKSTNYLLQEKLVKFLFAQDEWKKSGGRDHIIVAHHPNSLLDARMKLWPAIYILSDFGRYPPTVANVEKDVIAPYRHVIRSFIHDSSDFDSRPTLLYFQGALYRKDVSSLLSLAMYAPSSGLCFHVKFC